MVRKAFKPEQIINKLREAGFNPVEERTHYSTVFGTLTLQWALKPDINQHIENNQ
jgi:2-iminoacetate synthase ThiH